MSTAIEKANNFLNEYQGKLKTLKDRLHENTERIEILQLEIRMLNEVEIPKAKTAAVLEGTGNSEVTKLKNQLQKFRDELQEKQEEQAIFHHASNQYKIEVGEEAANLQKLIKDEAKLAEDKAYANMMHAKKQYIDTIIEQGQPLRELDALDAKIQSVLVDAGRQNGVYSGITVKTPLDPQNKDYHGGVYLQVSLQEAKNFVCNRYSKSDYDYLNKFANLKNL